MLPYETIRLGPVKLLKSEPVLIPLRFTISQPGVYAYMLASYPVPTIIDNDYLYAMGYVRITNQSVEPATTHTIKTKVEGISLSKNTVQPEFLPIPKEFVRNALHSHAIQPVCTSERIPYIFWIFFISLLSCLLFIKTNAIAVLCIALCGLLSLVALWFPDTSCTQLFASQGYAEMCIGVATIFGLLAKIILHSPRVRLHPSTISL